MHFFLGLLFIFFLDVTCIFQVVFEQINWVIEIIGKKVIFELVVLSFGDEIFLSEDFIDEFKGLFEFILLVFAELEELDFLWDLGKVSTDLIIETDLEFAGLGVVIDKGFKALGVVNLLYVEILMPLFDQLDDELLLGQL